MVLEALTALHELKVTHGDLSLNSIYAIPNDPKYEVKLSDYGNQLQCMQQYGVLSQRSTVERYQCNIKDHSEGFSSYSFE